jgi:hypothetical protein
MRCRSHAALIGLALAAVQAVPARALAAPGQDWDWASASPESRGMSGPKLAALKESLAAHATEALLVIRDDAVVLEWYAPGNSAAKPHSTASMAKALVAGVSLAIALGDGHLALDDPAAKSVPQWRDDPRKSRTTLRQLGSHTSGLDDAEEGGLSHDKLTGWKGAFWKRLDPPDDPFTIARDRVPVRTEPGAEMRYSNPGIAVLTVAVTAALRGTPAGDVRTLLRDRVMRPIGVPDAEWSVGYGRTFTVDGLPLVASWGGGSYTARAAARVGRLMLREGDWNGTRLLSREAVRAVTTDAGTPGFCGVGWWSNNEGVCDGLPRDAFWASGAGHQVLLVVPSLKLIAVRYGAALARTAPEPRSYHEPAYRLFFEPLVAAVTDRHSATGTGAATAPYPPSRVITKIEWAPRERIVRTARDSDNWPMTWADDGQLYTAFGDGRGFDRQTPKLSLGLARLRGGPTDFEGVNLRSPTLEQLGNGEAGKKASGLLMVDGVLYLWARNAGNAQLAWSADHGARWEWSDWKLTESFGGPTFLQFGPDYAGARDGYVYIFSHDHDSAYRPADRMVLARVPKGRIRERAAYEFFKGLGPDGEPLWTPDVAARGAVFTHPGKCYRSGISYDAGLKRYLWCQTLPGLDPRFRGGLGIFDAPEPWGPWTTVFSTEDWDVGPGETSSFPPAWMSADGKTLHLVFSGDDSFSVRQAVLTSASDAP